MNLASKVSLNNLVNCYIIAIPRQQVIIDQSKRFIQIVFKNNSTYLRLSLRYFSPTGRHQFSFPAYHISNAGLKLISFIEVAELLLEELAKRYSLSEIAIKNFLDQLNNSFKNMTIGLDSISDEKSFDLLQPNINFALSESALLTGHQFHPTPKSCHGFDSNEYQLYYPEFRKAFQLHYFKVAPEYLAIDNILEDDVRKLINDHLLEEQFAGEGFLLPVHPWQANYLLQLDSIQRMLKKGAIQNLGPAGRYFQATSSIRSVYNTESAYMLKFSLNVMITNSVRMNQERELYRAIAVARFWQSNLAFRFRNNYPNFSPIIDPAYLCLKDNGQLIEESAVLIRENPFIGNMHNVSCLAALCQDNPLTYTNRLSAIINHLAFINKLSLQDATLIWFDKFIVNAIEPLLWLYSYHEIALEAHQQNLLLRLNDNGLPVAAYYRDSQGYYISERSIIDHIEIDAISKLFATGSYEFVSHHFSYYLLGNSLIGIINAFGSNGCCKEEVLVRRFIDFIKSKQIIWAGRMNNYLEYIIESSTLPFKDNLATRLAGLDELTAPLSQQSIYIEINNPFYDGDSNE